MVSNTEKGKQFQLRVRNALRMLLGDTLDMEVKLPIGDPPQLHTFDLATRDRRLVCECKAFAWTAGGNIPSAKITTLREAVTDLQQLPVQTVALLILQRDVHSLTNQTLADYFVRLNRHLIRQVRIAELDDDNHLRTVCGSIRGSAPAQVPE